MHAGTTIDLRARSHRDRRGVTSPLARCVLGERALYVAGRIPDHPRLLGFQRWVLPEQGWVVGRFAVAAGERPPRGDWYIDLDPTRISGDTWQIDDRLVDVAVYPGRYEVLDLAEFAAHVEGRAVALDEAVAVLRSLDALCAALQRLEFSGDALLREYAPDLPLTLPWEEVLGRADDAGGS